MRRCLAVLPLMLGLAVCPTAQAAGTVDLIVHRDPGLSAAERADIRDDAGVELERRLRVTSTELVSVPAGEAAAALRALNADPDVRWATRDGETHADVVTAADPLWSNLWSLSNTGQTLSVGGVSYPGIADVDMDVPEAWAGSTGLGVTVAVVDSGIQLDHPDLGTQLATNPGETGTDGFGMDRRFNGDDDDGNGLVDDWRGWDFSANDNDPADVKGHGTHVAGIIAAINGNHMGGTGAAPDAKVLNLRALGDDGSGTWSAAAEAFDLAGDMGVRVVNASLGGAGDQPIVTQAISAHPNTLYVVSAGNDTLDLETNTYSPCEVPAPNVLCVGASDSRDVIAGFSNYGTTAVDLFAPGVNVLSTYKGSSYAWMNGTSQAAPNTAAAAALVLARDPTLTAVEVKDALMSTVDPVAGLPSVANGRVNAERAVLSIPADSDTDGVLDGADSCPTRPGPAGNGGCPVTDPPVTAPPVADPPAMDPPTIAPPRPAEPSVTGVKVTVSRRHRAQVSATATAGTSLTIVVERKRGKRWTKVTAATAPAGHAVNLRKRLAAGSYRVSVTATGAGGASAPARKAFRVRR